MLRMRIRDLLGKGIELLEAAGGHVPSLSANLTSYLTLGPWEVDIDVYNFVFSSSVPVTAGANTVDVFNGAVATNHPIIAQFDPDTLSADVPAEKAVTGYRRVAAGTQVVVRLVKAAADETEDLSVLMRYERVIHEASAKATTYGAYQS